MPPILLINHSYVISKSNRMDNVFQVIITFSLCFPSILVDILEIVHIIIEPFKEAWKVQEWHYLDNSEDSMITIELVEQLGYYCYFDIDYDSKVE